MDTNAKTTAFYEKLLSQLEDTTKFPSDYLYKFIVPTNNGGVDEVLSKFEGMNATTKTRASKNGKYTSVSIQVKMKSAQSVIDKYKDVTTIEGIISL